MGPVGDACRAPCRPFSGYAPPLTDSLSRRPWPWSRDLSRTRRSGTRKQSAPSAPELRLMACSDMIRTNAIHEIDIREPRHCERLQRESLIRETARPSEKLSLRLCGMWRRRRRRRLCRTSLKRYDAAQIRLFVPGRPRRRASVSSTEGPRRAVTVPAHSPRRSTRALCRLRAEDAEPIEPRRRGLPGALRGGPPARPYVRVSIERSAESGDSGSVPIEPFSPMVRPPAPSPYDDVGGTSVARADAPHQEPAPPPRPLRALVRRAVPPVALT